MRPKSAVAIIMSLEADLARTIFQTITNPTLVVLISAIQEDDVRLTFMKASVMTLPMELVASLIELLAQVPYSLNPTTYNPN